MKKILVVDDNDFVRDVVVFMLQSEGYDVIEAIHGKDALEKLNGRRVDMVITDLMMPEMNGLEFIAEMKSRDIHKSTPVVMLTAALPPASGTEEMRKAGIENWLQKPVQGEVLLNIVSRFLKTDGKGTETEGKKIKERLHCWEVKKCGREPGGVHAFDSGICPASLDKRLDGVHGGKNAGRACWIVSGTMCEGEIQGTFARKYSTCKHCDFYTRVREEEFPNFKTSGHLLERLKLHK